MIKYCEQLNFCGVPIFLVFMEGPIPEFQYQQKSYFLYDLWRNNRIYHHIAEGTRESHPSVHDLQSKTRLAKSWMLQIMDTRMGFPCPFCNVVIDYFSPTPFIFRKRLILRPF